MTPDDAEEVDARAEMLEDIIALLPEAKKLWEDHPPHPPSEKAVALARRLLRLTPLPTDGATDR